VLSEAQELAPFSVGIENEEGNAHPQELVPATAAMNEMEAGKQLKRNGGEVSPYRPGH
jgi:hypothetical protein